MEGLLFGDLPLSNEVQLAVQMAGYVKPTDIQAEILPMILEGRDVLGQSQTGTGKTAAFALPALSNLDPKLKQPQILVLAPTRELALQVSKSFETYGACIPNLKIAAIYGGADYEPQLRNLKRGAQIVVGTPGRIIDHIKRGTLRLDSIRFLVLDEADEMLAMGFAEDVEFILSKTPTEKQTALFSATLPAPIRKIADNYLRDPANITIRHKQLTADSIEQKCVFVDERDKLALLSRMLDIEPTDGVIVFTKTKDSTVHVAEHLAKLGINAAALNGDLPQARRQRTVDQLKSGRIDILVATDVAARGLDVERISHVFNYDLPHDGESYVHRIGRTGRAGRSGVAVIFLTPRQRGKLRLIERITKKTIEIVEPPSAREINLAHIARFKQQISDTVQKEDLGLFQKILHEQVSETGQSIEVVAAALAHLCQRGRPFLVKDLPKRESHRDRGPAKKFEKGPRQRRGSRHPQAGMRRYWIGVGRSDGVQPGNIVGAVANEANISGSQIGPIDINDSYSTIDLPDSLPKEALNTLEKAWVSGKQLRIRPFTPAKADRFAKDRTGERQSGGPARFRKGGKGANFKGFDSESGGQRGSFKKAGGKKAGGKKAAGKNRVTGKLSKKRKSK